MIFISTSCVGGDLIKDRVRVLAEAGFKQIELSGGTRWYPDFENDLVALRTEFGLEYICHNYFPPPQEDFVFNLASLDNRIWIMSKEMAVNAVRLCQRLGLGKLGLHAGFYTDIPLAQIGQVIETRPLNDKTMARSRFISAYQEIKILAENVQVYLENNVLSAPNYQNLGPQLPFMLLNEADYAELSQAIDFRLLLDVAHLKVSCQTLGLPFKSQLLELIPKTDYIHVSDTEGLLDTNSVISHESELWQLLTGHDLKNKTITLEVKASVPELKSMYTLFLETVYEH